MKFSFCGACFKRIWHGSETFPKGSSQNQIVPLLVVFHLPYHKYNGVKICFYSCGHQNQNFSLVSHSCLSCSTRVVLVSLVSHPYRTCVALVLLVSHWRCIRVARLALVSLVSETSFVNQTRSVLKTVFYLYDCNNNIQRLTIEVALRVEKTEVFKIS